MKADYELDEIDSEIYKFLDLKEPQSFLLFAGAGSGKTKTLVNVLGEVKKNDLDKLVGLGQRVAVITYTNAACEEIKQRLNYDASFSVSTIHSFAWSLINAHTEDIKEYLAQMLNNKVEELKEKLAKAKNPNNKTALQNKARLEKTLDRLESLKQVRNFIYSPTELLGGRSALNHAEVIEIASYFLFNKPLLQQVLIRKFPILLIDESQDTFKNLLEAFIHVREVHKHVFCFGIIGDQMQRIYGGGKNNIAESLGDDWKIVDKKTNYRSPKRIIDLINSIRKDDDGWQQEPFKDEVGVVRLFIVNSERPDKDSIENYVRDKMAEETDDLLWKRPVQKPGEIEVQETVKCLILEHAMAAIRGQFSDFLLPLLSIDKYRDGAVDGSRKEFSFLINVVVPFINSIKQEDDFGIMKSVKLYGNLVSEQNSDFVSSPFDSLRDTKARATELKELIAGDGATIFDVLKLIKDLRLIEIPSELSIHLIDGELPDEGSAREDDKITTAWGEAFSASIENLVNYALYTNGRLGYATHQGVKGLEFDRVMAVLDDKESKGFMFSYEKLFGTVAKSKTDLENEQQNKDSAVSRTRRLFYVVCSRAQKSLAVVAYTSDPNALKSNALETWFKEEEVIVL